LAKNLARFQISVYFWGRNFAKFRPEKKKNSTYTKDFPLKTWPKFTGFWK
jgi:hypothetical protein